MTTSITTAILAAAGLLLAASASAQTQTPRAPKAPPTDAASGLPFCSAQVKDQCIQKSDLKRQSMASASRQAAANP